MKTKIKNKNKKDRQLKKKYWVPTKKFQLMKPTWQTQCKDNQQMRFSDTHLYFFENI